ncbi:unnamed protein product [Cuscuta epithymum]|uniref:Uncharacterized protein n=1 Tax=Cuscuta epithymum TaxID=186058 RepID=A0AAV0D014_9ASTE|nr:unnamed protein product [Cuscuta epithymum]
MFISYNNESLTKQTPKLKVKSTMTLL